MINLNELSIHSSLKFKVFILLYTILAFLVFYKLFIFNETYRTGNIFGVLLLFGSSFLALITNFKQFFLNKPFLEFNQNGVVDIRRNITFKWEQINNIDYNYTTGRIQVIHSEAAEYPRTLSSIFSNIYY